MSIFKPGLSAFVSLVIIALSIMPSKSFSQSDDIDVQITYKLSLRSTTYGNATLGKFTNTFKKTDAGYSVNAVTKAQGIAAIMIGSNEQQSCDFTFDQSALKATPVNYAGGTLKKEKYRVNFNWEDQIFQFGTDETLDMPDGYIIDNCSMPFALALAQGKGLADKTMYIIDGKKKRIRGYNLVSSDNEKIETPLGDMETVKVVLQRELRPDRQLTLWLSVNDQFMPVKVEEKRKSRTTTMLISEMSFS